MPSSPEALERVLEADLDKLFAGLVDDWSSVELYRALSETRWTKTDRPGEHVALDAGRAEATVNTLREHHGKVALELRLSGGEGEVSERAAKLLAAIGWEWRPTTGRFAREDTTEAQPA
jgi:hypothetical protein